MSIRLFNINLNFEKNRIPILVLKIKKFINSPLLLIYYLILSDFIIQDETNYILSTARRISKIVGIISK